MHLRMTLHATDTPAGDFDFELDTTVTAEEYEKFLETYLAKLPELFAAIDKATRCSVGA